jgi:hypothetical protein
MCRRKHHEIHGCIGLSCPTAAAAERRCIISTQFVVLIAAVRRS